MNKQDFEQLRDLPGKTISQEIRFVRSRATSPVVVADGIIIENSAAIELRMNISFNPQAGAKTINVVEVGAGPICRLDVDGPAHRPAGRSHKHAVQDPRCQDRNLPEGVIDRPELAGHTLLQVFQAFCTLAGIDHTANFDSPDEGDTR